MARFFRRGVTKFSFATAIADPSAPTRAELDGATAISPEISEITGFQFTNAPISTPDLDDNFTSQIEGEDTADNSTLMFYDQDNSTTIRDVLAKGTEGYILILPYGDIAAKRMETWPVKSLGVNDDFSMGADAAKYSVPFAITARPTQDAVVPA